MNSGDEFEQCASPGVGGTDDGQRVSGGLFDFLSGKNRRAPAWMQAAGLEWLYRTALEPRRLLVRYVTTNPHATYLLLTRPSQPVLTMPAEDARRRG